MFCQLVIKDGVGHCDQLGW